MLLLALPHFRVQIFYFQNCQGTEKQNGYGLDLADEKLNEDQAAWIRVHQEKIDWYNKQRELKRQAGEDLKAFDRGMQELYMASEQNKPKLSDYYHPSEQQQGSELAFIALSLTGLGYLVYRYL